MSPNEQFWWNWWVNLGIALGTLGAVFVALFGDVLRSRWFPPQLALQLRSSEGEKGPLKLTVQSTTEPASTTERWDEARWYHLRVINMRRWSPAKEVRIFLLRLEQPGPSGVFHETWSGEVPMTWRHQEVHPLVRTIGAAADCDLCRVEKDGKALTLLPIITPFSLKARWDSQCKVVAWLQAKSNLTDSPIIRVQISWDGSWEDGENEMKRHLEVKVLEPKAV